MHSYLCVYVSFYERIYMSNDCNLYVPGCSNYLSYKRFIFNSLKSWHILSFILSGVNLISTNTRTHAHVNKHSTSTIPAYSLGKISRRKRNFEVDISVAN